MCPTTWLGATLGVSLALAPGVSTAQDLEAITRSLQVIDVASIEALPIEQQPMVIVDFPSSSLELKISSTRESGVYVLGELVVFEVEVNRDAQVQIIGVDAAGDKILLFPNRFQPDAWLEGGMVHQIPGPDSDYRFRATLPLGITTVKAVATTSAETLINPDNLVPMGDFAAYPDTAQNLARSLTVEAASRPENEVAQATHFIRVTTAFLRPQSRPEADSTPSISSSEGDNVFNLTATIPQYRYRSGDVLDLTVTAERSCSPTVVNVDSRGNTLQLYPRGTTQGMLIKPHEPTQLSQGQEEIQLQGHPGPQTLVILCAQQSVPLFAELISNVNELNAGNDHYHLLGTIHHVSSWFAEKLSALTIARTSLHYTLEP